MGDAIRLCVLAIMLASCDFPSNCDEKLKELYPGQDMIVWVVNSEVTVYRVQDQYLTCDLGDGRLDVRTLKPRTWVEAYCSRMVHPKECLEREKAKPEEKEEPHD